MARKTTTLMPLTGVELNKTGDAVPGDSYYGYTDGIHTVAIYGRDFSGRIKIQGTLATQPTEDDWFDISGTSIDQTNIDGSTLAFHANFTGNFVWVRAKVSGMSAGSITKILYNH